MVIRAIGIPPPPAPSRCSLWRNSARDPINNNNNNRNKMSDPKQQKPAVAGEIIEQTEPQERPDSQDTREWRLARQSVQTLRRNRLLA